MAASIALLDRAPVGNSNLPAVKICGFTELSNLCEIAAIDGVDAIGLNFFPKSKRAITRETALDWKARWNLRELGVLIIGVFVNPTSSEVIQLHQDGIIDVAQLHGTEPPSQVAELIGQGIPVIKAHGLKSRDDLDAIESYSTPYHLIDAFAPGVWGGTGETVDWSLLRDWASSGPSSRRIVLSGGIRPDNVEAAASEVHPSMIDVASGVETSPGIKSADYVKNLLNQLNNS